MGRMTYEPLTDEDLQSLLDLYAFLHPNDPVLPLTDDLLGLWERIQNDPYHFILGAFEDGALVSTCVLVLVPNLTRGARPYGLIENVVTLPDYRNRGIATDLLRYALDLAWEKNAYKVMLMTSRKDEAIMRFYEKAGFISGEKTGFIAKPSG